MLTVTLASDLQKTVNVKVQKTTVKTEKITGLKKKMTLKAGKHKRLSPITSQEKVTYASSNKNVATVNNKGVITAKKAGKTTITVHSGKKTFKIKVTVKK
ncbi:MAG: Ig-like domain-containing protein [Eubacteriales bacterium]|nr:Ig-like domain-containing protein [Eubacteriales bacterium]